MAEVDVRDIELELDESEQKEIEDTLAKLYPPQEMETTLPNVIVVSGLPVVNEKKYEKLLKVVRKLCQAADKMAPPPEITMPTDEASGETVGCAFVEYELPRTATQAVLKLDGHALDKAHTLRAHHFDDIERLMNVPDEYTPLPAQTFEEVENLQEWLLDERAVDQYVIRYAERTEVYFNDLGATGNGAEMVVGRDNWTETGVMWSPRGSYLTTFHRQGIALWGGPSWKRIVRFSHPGVKFIHFSPCERYLVTLSNQFITNDDPADPKAICVWDVRTGKKLRGFTAPKGVDPDTPPPWPLFKWSHDDKYMARLGTDAISIYAAPTFELLNKKSLAVRGVQGFEWSPANDFLAYYTPESDNVPARVSVIKVPSRKQMRSKNLFNVTGVRLHWSANGDYLAVKVDRVKGKAKKPQGTNFEIFRMREPQIPIDVVEVAESLASFAWEPHGKHFGVVLGDGPRYEVRFYSLKGKAVEMVHAMENKACNTLVWSPRGRFVVLAGLVQLNGQLEFFDVQEKESLGTDEHFMCTSVEWDPSGRFVTTVVSYWQQQLETGFSLFDFQGHKVRSLLKNQFFQLLWRPRPPTVLPKKRVKYIEEHLDEYIGEIKRADAKSKVAAREAEREKRQKLKAEFDAALRAADEAYAAERERRVQLYGFDPDAEPSDVEEVEEWVETVLSTKESVIKAEE